VLIVVPQEIAPCGGYLLNYSTCPLMMKDRHLYRSENLTSHKCGQ
jgi:hypothetical protein